jgi:hypothetical protein
MQRLFRRLSGVYFAIYRWRPQFPSILRDRHPLARKRLISCSTFDLGMTFCSAKLITLPAWKAEKMDVQLGDLFANPEHAVLLLVDQRAGHRNRNIAEQEQR